MSATLTDSMVDVLVEHQWETTRWGDGRGGYSWDCTCGIVSWGTGIENPERYRRYPLRDDARIAAAAHVRDALVAASGVAVQR